ncbi:hypothetical protein K474DRAFT_1706323 [Panus rudis PR-1116 ss-1]|nr:hypothetical protein K474DRAFT_1706323 [Panus rudis PR-1116 ss-1]
MFRVALAIFVLATTAFWPSSAAPAAVKLTGDATFFEPGLGACGAFSSPNDLIVALSPSDYAGGSHCFRHILVNWQGRTVDATVVDLCPSCNPGSIDLSPAAFQQLASLNAGRLTGVNWNFE